LLKESDVSQIRTVVKALAASVAFGASASQATTDAPSTVFDEDVRVVRFVDMSYPLIAGVAGIQGAVVVKAELDADGRVLVANAVSGSRALVEPCVANVKKWQFESGSRSAIVVYLFTRTDGMCDRQSVLFSLRKNVASVTTCIPTVQASDERRP
jgi:outer membrane biosynthesis protein TonB